MGYVMQVSKKDRRLRRARKMRGKMAKIMSEKGGYRLTVHKTSRHIYATIVGLEGQCHKVLAHASSLNQEIRTKMYTGGKLAATEVGRLVAEAAKNAGITRVMFDRSGFAYHGRVRALADAAREAGLEI